MPKPALTDFATILDKENTEPLFDLAWGAFKVPGEDAVAKTPAEARDALGLSAQVDVDEALSEKVDKSGDTMTGQLTLPATDPTLNDHAVRKAYVDDQIDKLYPIGSIYFCAAATDPNSSLPGTWTLLTEGQFLVSAGGAGDYALGNTGGEASHTLTIDELPAHSHSIKVRGDAGVGTQARLVPWGDPDYAGIWDAYSAQNPMQPIGTNQAHENRPPFLAVNMWQRTA